MLFPSTLLDNDLAKVDAAIREFYEMDDKNKENKEAKNGN